MAARACLFPMQPAAHERREVLKRCHHSVCSAENIRQFKGLCVYEGVPLKMKMETHGETKQCTGRVRQPLR